MSRALDGVPSGAPGALGALLGVCVASVALQLAVPLNHDVGWLLSAARRWLEGGTLYRDTFVDVKPPLAVFLSAPVVSTGEFFGISEVTAARLFTLLGGGASLLFTHYVLRSIAGPDRLRARLLFLTALAFVFGVLPGVRFDAIRWLGHFGQREHWIAMGWFPYLVMAAGRASGRRVSPQLAVIGGLLLGLCVSLKPQFLLAIASTELYVLLATRRMQSLWRPELLTMGATGAGYVIVVFLNTPDYFDVAVPLGLRTYWAYQTPVSGLIKAPDVVLLGVAGLALAAQRTPGQAARSAGCCSRRASAAMPPMSRASRGGPTT